MRYKYADAPEYYPLDASQEKLMLDLLDMDGTDVAVVELTYTPDGLVVKHLAQYRKDPYDVVWADEVVKMFPEFTKELRGEGS